MEQEKRDRDEKEDNDELPDDTITSLAGAQVFEKFKKNLKRSPSSQPQISTENKIIFVPPDGGYGWVVVLGAFFTIFWTSGVNRACGMLINAIIAEFPDKSPALVSWIPACMTAVTMLVGPLTSAMSQRFSHRIVTMAGSIICCLSLCTSFLFFSVETIFICLGGFVGLGLGLSCTPGTVLVACYFVKHRAKANALCMSGSALGCIVLPFAMQICLDAFGLRYTLLILGLAILSVCISASAYRPTETHASIQNRRRTNKGNKRDDPAVISTLLEQKPERRQGSESRRRSSLAQSLSLMALAEGEESLSASSREAINEAIGNKRIRSVSESLTQTRVQNERQRASVDISGMMCDAPPKKVFEETTEPKSSSDSFGMALLKEPLMLLLLSAILCIGASPAFFHLLPPFALQLQLEKQAPMLLSIGAIVDFVFRFVISFLLDMGWVPLHVVFSALILCIGLAAFCFPFVNGLVPMALLVALAAVGYGGFVLTTPLILAEKLGVEQLNASYGLSRLAQAIGSLFFPVVAGYLWDSTGKLDASYFFIGGVVMLGSLFPLLTSCVAKKEKGTEAKFN